MEIFIVLMNGYPYEARSSRAAAMTLVRSVSQHLTSIRRFWVRSPGGALPKRRLYDKRS